MVVSFALAYHNIDTEFRLDLFGLHAELLF